MKQEGNWMETRQKWVGFWMATGHKKNGIAMEMKMKMGWKWDRIHTERDGNGIETATG